MRVHQERDGDAVTIALEGRLDGLTAPGAEQAVMQAASGAERLAIDIGGLAYVSSAGLRVFAMSRKTMRAKGGAVIRNAHGQPSEALALAGLEDMIEGDA